MSVLLGSLKSHPTTRPIYHFNYINIKLCIEIARYFANQDYIQLLDKILRVPEWNLMEFAKYAFSLKG